MSSHDLHCWLLDEVRPAKLAALKEASELAGSGVDPTRAAAFRSAVDRCERLQAVSTFTLSIVRLLQRIEHRTLGAAS